MCVITFSSLGVMHWLSLFPLDLGGGVWCLLFLLRLGDLESIPCGKAASIRVDYIMIPWLLCEAISHMMQTLTRGHYMFSSILSIMFAKVWEFCWCTKLYTLFNKSLTPYIPKFACSCLIYESISCPCINGCDRGCFKGWP